MDFLKSGLKSVLGSPEPGDQATGSETVERLVDRLTTSSQLDDRRDACRALKALSRTYRIDVGAQGMPALLQVLETDGADCEIIGYALDTLCNVTAVAEYDAELDDPLVAENVGEQFTEMLCKTASNVAIIINYLAEFDFRVRWPAIKLLSTLLANRPKDIQQIVLVSPMAVSKLMDLLGDAREVIRNDALLLLVQLTRGNGNLQKIVAFENAFDRLFDVVCEEGGCDGGIVVEDCLVLMLTLLQNNASNQQFFKEGSYIQRLAPMFRLPAAPDDHAAEPSSVAITPQMISNLHCMLRIVRSLVSPANAAAVVAGCQRTMRGCGLLQALCDILMGSGVPVDILSETINAVAEVCRGDTANQEFLSAVTAPSNPPRPAIVVLLMSMVNEKQPFGLRCAVLYCFECHLYRNEAGQLALVQTLLPSGAAPVSTLTAGQLLCGGLFSTDALANWFSAVSLMHGLIENPAQKEQLLRVLLATSAAPGAAPVSLLQQCTALLQQSKYRVQSKLGVLMLLATWLANCPLAVRAFVESPGTVGFLIAQIGANEHDDGELLVQGVCAFLMGICIQFNDDGGSAAAGTAAAAAAGTANYRREDLCQLVVKRIGLETFGKKLSEVSRHEAYSRAAKQPQILAGKGGGGQQQQQHQRGAGSGGGGQQQQVGGDLLLDYEFCKLFKAMEAIIVKTMNGIGNDANITELTLSSEAAGLVAQYKDIIREQDFKLQTVRNELHGKHDETEALRKQLLDAQQSNTQLFDQNILLKAQLAAATTTATATPSASHPHAITQSTQISFYEAENARLVREVGELNRKFGESLTLVSAPAQPSELAQVRKEQEELLELLSDQESKIQKYRQRLMTHGEQVTDDEAQEDE